MQAGTNFMTIESGCVSGVSFTAGVRMMTLTDTTPADASHVSLPSTPTTNKHPGQSTKCETDSKSVNKAVK